MIQIYSKKMKSPILFFSVQYKNLYILTLRNDLFYFHSITIFLCDPSKTNEWPILKWMLFTSFEHYVRNVNICFLRNVLSKVFYALCTRAALKIFFEEKIKDKKLIPEKILFFFNVALKLFLQFKLKLLSKNRNNSHIQSCNNQIIHGWVNA